MKVIVAGSRGFASFAVLSEALDELLGDAVYAEDFELVSGGARGADRLGERYAEAYGATVRQFIPQWDKFGKRAGIMRNDLMSQYATHLVAFWDGVSAGTSHMIESARKRGLVVHVVRV